MVRMSLRDNDAVRRCPRSKRSLIAATCLACLFVFPSHRADAQDAGFWFGYGSPYPRRALSAHRHTLPPKRAREVYDQGDLLKGHGRGASTEPIVSRPLFAVLSLSNQHISVYNSTGPIARFKVSTGMPGHRHPDGHIHHHRPRAMAPLQHLQRCTDAIHAAHHLVGRGAARGRGAAVIQLRMVASAFRLVRQSASGA